MNSDLTLPPASNAVAAPPSPSTASSSAQDESGLPPPKRFKFSNEKELQEMAKGFTPANTNKATQWALKVFDDWRTARNKQFPVEQAVPENLLDSSDPEVLNTHFSRLAIEARKVNGERYPPSTVHQLLCGILRHMRNSNPECPNFLNKKVARFKPLQNTLDSLFNSLHSEGIGIQVKHSETLSKDDEDKLWSSGTMGYSCPTSLQNAAFFVFGKFFTLRGGVEHRNLKLSQLRREKDPCRQVNLLNNVAVAIVNASH